MLSNLSFLHAELLNYTPPKIKDIVVSSPKNSIFSKLLSVFKKSPSSKDSSSLSAFDGPSSLPIGSQPKGIYLYGDVGSGKTMLMDMFYTTVPKHLTKKRIHFHAFMQDVHKRNHKLHEKYGLDYDTAPTIATEIAQEANVLCFDEFQVTDVADAMILRRLYENFLSPRLGVVIFMTSNRAPDELYKDGIQRSSFIPTIELIKLKCHVLFLDSPTDYRKIDRPSQGTYFAPPLPTQTLADVKDLAQQHVDKWFEYFSQGMTQYVEYNVALTIWGRPVIIPKCIVGVVAQFTFDELCNQPLSAADYLEITSQFAQIIITDIPLLSVRQKDVTRRFITFLDAAYESHSKIAVTSEKPFDQLFTDEIPTYGKKSKAVLEAEERQRKLKEEEEKMLKDKLPPTSNKEKTIDANNNSVAKDPNDIDDDFISNSNMFSGEEERFAFARALSRLKQMASKEWHEYQVPK